MKVTLFRATNDDASFGSGACFSPDESTAEAYTDNPGYGGETVLAFDLEIDKEEILSLLSGRSLTSGSQARDAFERLADALDVDAEELAEETQYVIHDAIDRPSIRKKLSAAGFDWVVYEDTFPEGAITWTYCGSKVVALK